MKISKLFTALSALIVISCLFGAQGQYGMGSSQTTTGLSVGSSSMSQYTQFYTMPTGPAPSVHISAPVQFNITSGLPSNLYFSTQNQIVPYSQYTSNPANAGVNSLWIRGVTDWTQYAVAPQGATMSLMAVSSTGGSGYLTEMRPDGTMYNTNFYFYPYGLLTFYADTIGRHVLSFVINGQTSNTVIIDVTGTYVPPSTYYLPPAYYQGSYYSNFFPGFYGFGFSNFGQTTSTTSTSSVSNTNTKVVSGGNNNGKEGGKETSANVVSGNNQGSEGNKETSANVVSGSSKENGNNKENTSSKGKQDNNN